jgi:hypothetical protein
VTKILDAGLPEYLATRLMHGYVIPEKQPLPEDGAKLAGGWTTAGK